MRLTETLEERRRRLEGLIYERFHQRMKALKGNRQERHDRLMEVGHGLCYACGDRFPESEVRERVGRLENRAMCPKCGIDAVLPGDVEISQWELEQMQWYYFSMDTSWSYSKTGRGPSIDESAGEEDL